MYIIYEKAFEIINYEHGLPLYTKFSLKYFLPVDYCL